MSASWVNSTDVHQQRLFSLQPKQIQIADEIGRNSQDGDMIGAAQIWKKHIEEDLERSQQRKEPSANTLLDVAAESKIKLSTPNKQTPGNITAPRRNDLTIFEKIVLLKQYDALPKCSQRKAASELHISQPLLCKLLKNRDKLLNTSQAECDFARKRRRDGKDTEIEEALFKWYVRARQAEVPISRQILTKKAKDLAEQFGNTKFKATDGWLSRWKQRNNIVFRRAQYKQDAPQNTSTLVTQDAVEQCVPQAAINSTVSRKENIPVFDNSSGNSMTDDMRKKIDALYEQFSPSSRKRKEDEAENFPNDTVQVEDTVLDFSIETAATKEKNSMNTVKCHPKQEVEENTLPSFDEVTHAICVLRKAIMSYSCSTLDDYQNIYNIETFINKMYTKDEKPAMENR